MQARAPLLKKHEREKEREECRHVHHLLEKHEELFENWLFKGEEAPELVQSSIKLVK